MATRKRQSSRPQNRTAPPRPVPAAEESSPESQAFSPVRRESRMPKNWDPFYRAFEERHRGSREMIKERLTAYLPFVLHCQELYEECSVLDLGCGRGEWLELMQENGFTVLGVDLDEGMLEACEEKNLPVKNKDALETLRELPPESKCIISGFHIAEHLSFDALKEFVQESLRVLKPGGLLILETPNPENLTVGTSSFYLDPTHLRPLPPELLSFLPQHYGFERIKIVRLQESPALKEAPKISVDHVIGGVSPDYAVIAQKKANPRRMALFDEAFQKEYGITLHHLTARYEASLSETIDEAASKATAHVEEHLQNVDSALQTRLGETEERLQGLDSALQTRLGETEERLQGLDSALQAGLGETEERLQGVEHAAGKRIGELRGDLAGMQREMDSRFSDVESHFGEADSRFSQIESHLRETGSRFSETDLRLAEHQRYLNEHAQAQVGFAEVQAHFARTLEVKFSQLEARTHQTEEAFRAVRNSRSWKMTAPYRALGDGLKGLWQKIKNLFKPALVGAMGFVIARPSLNRFALALLRPFPRLKARLKRLALVRGVVTGSSLQESPSPSALSGEPKGEHNE